MHVFSRTTWPRVGSALALAVGLLVVLWHGVVAQPRVSQPSPPLVVKYSPSTLPTSDVITGRVRSITFTSSWDGSVQRAYLNVPDPLPTEEVPVLIYLHGMFSCRAAPPFQTVVESPFGYAVARRGWILAAPELHGERPVPLPGDPWDPTASCPQPVSVGYRPMGARPAQRDVLDTLAYLQEHYPVDSQRVYLLSESAGGLTLLTALGKFADRFAAAVVYSSPSDLARWLREDSRAYPNIWREVGGLPEERPFDYARRSPLRFASNLTLIPLTLVHGREDDRVPVHHSRDLYAAILAADPQAHVYLYEYEGDHGGPFDPNDPDFFSPAQALTWLGEHRRPSSPERLTLLTDAGGRQGEPGEPELGPYRFWWAGWIPRPGPARWTHVALTRTVQSYQVAGIISDTVGLTLTLNTHDLGWEDRPVTVTLRGTGVPTFTRTLTPTQHLVTLPLPGGRVHVHVTAPTPVPTPTPTPTPVVGTVAGLVFDDRDGDGLWEEGEPGIPGARVELWANGTRLVESQVTGADGRFRFSQVTPGEYLVQEHNPPAWPLDTTVNQQFITLRAGDEVWVVFGDRKPWRFLLPVLLSH
ncbi:MAG: prolyl oligopeptidase family serine peptidase [Chloroflexi bacterium]|nr:prolyl oligopeptidase family serine peptidase [Chloroflexota bacterium]